MRFIHGTRGRRRGEFAEKGRTAPRDMPVRDHHLGGPGNGGGDRTLIAHAVGSEHQSRRHEVGDKLQLAVVLRDNRIRRRDRKEWDTCVQRRQCKHRVFKIILREDHQRPLGRQPPVDEALPDPARVFERMGIGDPAPLARRQTHGDERAVGRPGCPVKQALGQACGIGAERRRGFQQEAPLAFIDHRDAGWAKGNFADTCGSHGIPSARQFCE